MKILSSILLFFLGYYADAQTTIWFQIHRTDGCNNQTKIDSSDYYLIDKFGTGYQNSEGTVWLPALGEYEIYYPNKQDNNIYPVINITGNKNIYQHYDGKIKLKFTSLMGTSIFHDCNGRANGYKEDYFENGIVSLKGYFSEGEPKDSLLLFHRNGNIRKIISYLKKEIYIREFDSLSSLIKVSHKNNRPTRAGHYDFSAITYYPQGGIKINEKKVDDILTLTEYYPDNKIKTELNKKKKTEYYFTGEIQTETIWKILPDKNLPERLNKYEIVKKSFYKNGEVSEEIIYQTVQSRNSQPDLNLSMAIYFVIWKRLSPEGTERILFKEMFQDEVLKSDTFLELLNQSSSGN